MVSLVIKNAGGWHDGQNAGGWFVGQNAVRGTASHNQKWPRQKGLKGLEKPYFSGFHYIQTKV